MGKQRLAKKGSVSRVFASTRATSMLRLIFSAFDIIAVTKSVRPRDRKVDEAKAALMARFFSEGRRVFYGRQLEVLLEKEYFHWITKRALNELVSEHSVGFASEPLNNTSCHFYFSRAHRYPRRQIKEVLDIITEFSAPDFTRALGAHGEMLVESSFSRIGFRVLGQGVQEFRGVKWTQTDHDLDFLVMRDDAFYGVEVKNQLGYIDKKELSIKIQLCRHLGVRPLFCVRRMPTNYFNEVVSAGGYVQIAENQNYPLLAETLAQRVRSKLNLPVAVVRRLPETALTRFETWHRQNA